MKRSFTRYLIIVWFAFIYSKQAYGVNINVGGTITANTTWSADTVKVDSTVTISNGITLTISPGTYVQFQGHYAIKVEGRIIAQGTKTSSITFTALNTTQGWAGIRFHYPAATNDTSKIEYCTISYGKANTGNVFDHMGGAIYINGFSKVIVRNNYIANNYASSYGGGIAVRYCAPLITGNVVVNNTASSLGGGIYVYGATATMVMMNNTVANNNAGTGGGVYASSSTIYFYNGIVWGNAASTDAQISSGITCGYSTVEGGVSGGIYVQSSDPKFVAPTSGTGSAYNGLTADYGLQSSSPAIDKGYPNASNYGVLDFDALGNFRYDNERIDQGALEYISSMEVCGVISSNTTWSGNVLVNCNVTINSGVTLTIAPGTNIIFTGHHRIYNKGRILAIGNTNNKIRFHAWNKATGWDGIRMYNVSTSNDTTKFEYCDFSYAKKNSYGGLFYLRYARKVLIRNCVIHNNEGTYGGAFYIFNSPVRLIGNLVANNEATGSYGGAFYIYTSSSTYIPHLYNNTITRNKSYSYAAGIIKLSNYSPVLKNNIIYANEDNSGNHTLIDNIYPTSGMSITYSDVEGGYSGTGNINAAPQFKSATTVAGYAGNFKYSNFTLQSASPCIDAGTPSTTGLSLPAKDINGKVRVYNSRVDMGAYEDKSFLNVCGTISSDQLWDANVININCNVTIADGATVTIVPGTKVLFSGHYSITVKGAIQSMGSKYSPVVFTAANTTTGWDGLLLDFNTKTSSNDSCIFEYTKFEYANRTPTDQKLGGGALSVKRNIEVRISNCTFSHNKASGYYSRGAAIHFKWIYPNADFPKVENCVFSYNQGDYGILSLDFGKLQIKSNKFYYNTTSSEAVLSLKRSGSIVENNIIANNTGNSAGGVFVGIQYQSYTTRFVNNIIVNNSANLRGGGMLIYDVKPILLNNTIANNYGVSGGGICFSGNADANLKNNIIYGNEESGGVSNQICINDVAADPKIYNCDIEGGVSAFTGSGSGINYSGVFVNNIDANPLFASPSSGAGNSYNGLTADWYIDQGSPCINMGTANTSNLNLPSTDYDDNTRIYNGVVDMGAYENQDPIIASCNINEDTKWNADTIRVNCNVTVASGKTLTITPGTNVLFMGDYSLTVNGTLVANGLPNKRIRFMINDTTGFSNENTSSGGWGGIIFNSVLPTNDSSSFNYCVFTNGKADGQSGKGGAMYIYNSPKVKIENSIFTNNMATYGGGALYVESSNIVFRNNVVSNNTVRTATNGYYSFGAAIYFDDVIMNFDNNTIVNNRGENPTTYSYVFGGGIYANSSEIRIRNSLIWGNETSNSNLSGSQLYFNTSNNSRVINSNVQYGISKVVGGSSLASYTNNLDVNPQFGNATQGAGIAYDGLQASWRLAASSPMINKGIPSLAHTNTDMAGNTRFVADTLDIGAFEVQLSRKFITQQPSSTAVCEGTSTSFSVSLSINANYQWFHDGSILTGANQSSVTISSVQTSDVGSYYCVISTSDGSISTDTASLGIQYAPVITTAPSSTSACLGDSASFSIGATGTAPLVYTWENSLGQLSSSGNAGTYTIGTHNYSNAATSYPSTFANYYWGNKFQFIILASELTAAGVSPGNINSISFNVLNVNSCPALSDYTISMKATTMTAMQSAFVTGLTQVYSAASYQPVSGWNEITFQTPFSWDGSSNIVVQICSNNTSWVQNGNASIALSITNFVSSTHIHQDALGVCSKTSGTTASVRPYIRLRSANVGNLVYYVIDSVLASDASIYKCNVSNMCGSTLSTGAQLTVKNPPAVVPLISSSDVCENQSFTFTTSATGAAPITYQWYKDGSAISGETAVSYTISSVSASDDGIYYCKASNACGDDSTNQSILNVDLVPSITTQPSSLVACENQSAMFNVQASGSPTLTYQWYKGGSAISGGNSSALFISSVATSDAGSYYCKVTNSCGDVTSATATFTVNSNVSITAQSTSQTLCEGASPTLSVTASGTAPITYQWFNKNGAISGATNNTYSISSIDTSDAGNYYCVVSNTCSSVSSNPILLTVNQAPTIVSSPQPVNTCENTSAVFTVSANGTAPVSYQWYGPSGQISGATASSYIISQTTTSDAGLYYVKATNGCGSVTSASAQLTVNENVSITAQSSSKTECSGNAVSFSITAAGTAPVTYQWYKNGSAIGGATNGILNISSVDTSDAANYYVIASNGCNSVQSNTMTLVVNESPSIDNQPVSSTVCSGSAIQLNVSASGTAPLSYQWYKGGSSMSGETNSYLLISSATTSDAGSYYVKISNSCGSVTSQTAGVTVNEPVALTSQSLSQTACSGNSVSFNVTAAGTSPISYQWYKDGGVISAATNNTLNLTNVDTSDAASYYVVVGNSCNSVQSNIMSLTVNEAPAITSQPVSATACAGSSAMLSITASGTSPLTYQWYKGTSALNGATNATYLVGSAASANGGSYYCVVSNSCGTQTSNAATLTVNNPVLITAQSGDSTKCVGNQMLFTINTSGTAPITYQWYHNGNSITGATSSTYGISSVSTTDAGDYYCIATNSCASVQSSMKALVVNTAPSINQQSNDTTICAGNNVTLSVSASGSSPITYQWYKGGVGVGGAVSSIYPIYQTAVSDSGTYYCVAANSCGTDQSNNIHIGVNTAPSIVYQSDDSSRCEGENMTFKVVASGTAPLSYQWYFGQNAINGADSSVYQISSVLPANDGYYYAKISNMCSSVNSANKYLTVHQTPSIALGPDTSFCEGGSVMIGPGYGYYCVWNNGQIASQINVTDSGSYSATVTDNWGCTGSTDTININVLHPYSGQNICLVTIDSATGKNVVVWEKTPNQGIASFNIYKETNISGVYSLLGNRPYDSLSIMIDMASNPSVTADRYVLTVVDTCGNESAYSVAHRTMHLTVNKGQNNDWNLIWNAYEGFTPSSYKIYRADTSMNFVNIATVAGSSNYTYLYTDQNVPAGQKVFYYVEVLHPKGGCSATKTKRNYHTTRSNRANNGGTANTSNLLPAFFGTPTSGVFPLDVHFFDQSIGNPTEWEWDFGDGTIDTVQNPTHTYTQIGVYSVSLVIKNSSGINSLSFQNYVTVLTTGIEDVSEEFVVKVFPNPYTGNTNIAYALIKPQQVKIEIYNAVGMLVAVLVDDEQSPGSYKYQFNAEDYGFAAGVYYMRMRVDDQLYTEKLIQVK